MIISSATVARRDGGAATPSTRRLAVTWQHQHPGSRLIRPIGILSFDGQRYGFHYLENVKNVDGFRPLLGFADLRETYTSTRLFPLFSQRIMDPARPDYQRYVTRLGLKKLPFLPSHQTMRMMAKAAVAVDEAEVDRPKDDGPSATGE